MISGGLSVGPADSPIRLDLDRMHTDAEVELVGYCFGCSREEAKGILSIRPTKEFLGEVRGVLDALTLERMESQARAFVVPEWLRPSRGK